MTEESTRQDRKSRREREFHPAYLAARHLTPVLVLYWTQEYLEVYLVPATPVEVELLKKLNGVICNDTMGWEDYSENFDYLGAMQCDPTTGEDGPWKVKYLVDANEPDGNPLDPCLLPPGTLVVSTGMVV